MTRRWQWIAAFTAGVMVGGALMDMTSQPAAAEAAGEPAAEEHLAKVVQVNHGDEFEILWRPPMPLRFNVRLNRVDTPFSDQPGGREATEALADLIYGKHVRIDFEDNDKPYQDRSERLIAYAFIGGRNVNVEMVRSGHSAFVTRWGEGKYAEQFREAEAEAKTERRGRWARSEAPADRTQ